jgi:hypothetical protein
MQGMKKDVQKQRATSNHRGNKSGSKSVLHGTNANFTLNNQLASGFDNSAAIALMEHSSGPGGNQNNNQNLKKFSQNLYKQTEQWLNNQMQPQPMAGTQMMGSEQ